MWPPAIADGRPTGPWVRLIAAPAVMQQSFFIDKTPAPPTIHPRLPSFIVAAMVRSAGAFVAALIALVIVFVR